MLHFIYTRKPNFKTVKKIDYDSYWQKRGFAINKKLKEREKIILDLIPVGLSVLDIGCGNSLLPVKLKEKGCKVMVADISKQVLRGYNDFDIPGVIIDIEKQMDELNQKFDFIIFSEVLEHVRFPEDVINQIKDKAERIFITIPNSAFYRYRLGLMFGGRFFTQWVYHPSEHLRFWSHVDFLDWLDALGIEVERCEASNGLSIGPIKLFNIWKNLFGHQIVYMCKRK
jgi:methionine biosynthesis protein MetW